MQSSVTGRKANENTLTARLTRSPYRRAVACAWLTVCERQHRYPHLTLESLEAAIAAELEGFFICASTVRKRRR